MDKEILLPTVGQRVKKLRNERGYSQQEFGYLCDMDGSNIARIEMGQANITLKTLYRISQALGVKMSDVVDVE